MLLPSYYYYGSSIYCQRDFADTKKKGVPAVMQSQSQTQQTRESAQFQLRLPDDLKARIQAVTKATARSVNSEILVALLERFLPEELALDSLVSGMDYLRANGDTLEASTRTALMESRLREVNARANIEYNPHDGSITLTIKP
jgi:predicted transcriptional regulator